jgi:hypothetical protein
LIASFLGYMSLFSFARFIGEEHEGCNNGSPSSWFIRGEHEERNNDRPPSWSVEEEGGFLCLSSFWSIEQREEGGCSYDPSLPFFIAGEEQVSPLLPALLIPD